MIRILEFKYIKLLKRVRPPERSLKNLEAAEDFLLKWLFLKLTKLLEPHHISHIQSMVPKRGCTNQVNVHTPM